MLNCNKWSENCSGLNYITHKLNAFCKSYLCKTLSSWIQRKTNASVSLHGTRTGGILNTGFRKPLM